MTTVLVTGGTGLVGRYVVEDLLAHGYDVRIATRTAPPEGLFSRPVGYVRLDLRAGPDPGLFDDIYHVVHAAFDHLPGRYRGGEGEDPDGFRRLNGEATVRLFEMARRAGIRRCIFLSSRAVYDGLPAGAPLSEDAELAPDSLYGEVKMGAEQALAALTDSGFSGASLRMTGVYGDLRPGKWDGLFADFLSGRPVPSRAGSEVHGRDTGAAVRLLLETDRAAIAGRSFNLSDIVVDTRDILAPLAALAGSPQALPAPADASSVRVMPTDRIRALGWRPGGTELFKSTLESLAGAAR